MTEKYGTHPTQYPVYPLAYANALSDKEVAKGWATPPIMVEPELSEQAISMVMTMCRAMHANEVSHGWYDNGWNTGEKIALMHSELSEALEGDRNGIKDKHLPEYDSMIVEFADVIIRIMSFCAHIGQEEQLAEAILKKHIVNVNRPYKHGGKKY